MRIKVEESKKSEVKHHSESSIKLANSTRNLVVNTSVSFIRFTGVAIYLLLSGLVSAMVYVSLLPFSSILTFLDNAYFVITPEMQKGAVAIFAIGLFTIHMIGNSHNITNKENLSEVGAATAVFGLMMLIGLVVSIVVGLPLETTLMLSGAFWLLVDTITDFSQ